MCIYHTKLLFQWSGLKSWFVLLVGEPGHAPPVSLLWVCSDWQKAWSALSLYLNGTRGPSTLGVGVEIRSWDKNQGGWR